MASLAGSGRGATQVLELRWRDQRPADNVQSRARLEPSHPPGGMCSGRSHRPLERQIARHRGDVRGGGAATPRRLRGNAPRLDFFSRVPARTLARRDSDAPARWSGHWTGPRKLLQMNEENWWRRRESKRCRPDARNLLRDANFPRIRLHPLENSDPAVSFLVPLRTGPIRRFMATLRQLHRDRLDRDKSPLETR